jgi:Protein of unknown function (DUF4058)
MPSPFPGMNPYLEHPDFWPGLHHLLISELVRLLSPQLRPKYLVSLEVRMYETDDENTLLVGIPDVSVLRPKIPPNSLTSNVAIAAHPAQPLTVKIPIQITVREGYLEIKEVSTQEVITVIEILSPTNKRQGKGREKYEQKRKNILGSRTNFVEIDLLRSGQIMPIINNVQSDYRILICRGDRRPLGDLYAFNLRDSIPIFPLPLRLEDNEPMIDLQGLLNEIYELAAYDLKIDYNSWEPVPKLSDSDGVWVDSLLRDQGLRQ